MYTPFKILKVLWSESLGTTHNYIEEVECPDCGYVFTRKSSNGCFHHSIQPFTCPRCNYPWNKPMLKSQRSEEDDYNPSKRNR